MVIAPSRALAAGAAIIPNSAFAGFTDVAMQRSDDGSWPSDVSPAAFPFGFNINYFGAEETGAFVNNNGNITFGSPQSSYSPFGLAGTTLPIIAPFFADVDTYSGNTVDIGTGTLDGFKIFVANWPGVECYPATNSSVLDNFQVILVDRPDLGTGAHGDDFQIEFNYNSIQWDAGEASGGNPNCTGSPDTDAAAVGYSDGTQTTGHYYQLPGSQTSGALLELQHHERPHLQRAEQRHGHGHSSVGNPRARPLHLHRDQRPAGDAQHRDHLAVRWRPQRRQHLGPAEHRGV